MTVLVIATRERGHSLGRTVSNGMAAPPAVDARVGSVTTLIDSASLLMNDLAYRYAHVVTSL